MSSRVVAIIGSYRKGGTTDTAIEAILAGAREKGAITHSIYLTERHIEFCKNCRECTQTPGLERGKCKQHDDLEPILAEIEASDAVVLGSPINYGSVTTIYRRFLERLLGYAYWPWGGGVASVRKKRGPRRAALVASSAMPGFLIPLLTGGARTLNRTAGMLGAKTVGSLWIG